MLASMAERERARCETSKIVKLRNKLSIVNCKIVNYIMNRINMTDGELAVLATRIQRNYDYDDRLGLLVNKRTGKVVKGVKRNKRGYRGFDFWYCGKVKHMKMHRAIWVWHYGCFPMMEIDHINGNKADNRIENLREVSDHENKLNIMHDWKPNKDTGLTGVSPHENRYRTFIHGKEYHFSDPFEAFFHATMCGKRYK